MDYDKIYFANLCYFSKIPSQFQYLSIFSIDDLIFNINSILILGWNDNIVQFNFNKKVLYSLFSRSFISSVLLNISFSNFLSVNFLFKQIDDHSQGYFKLSKIKFGLIFLDNASHDQVKFGLSET